MSTDEPCFPRLAPGEFQLWHIRGIEDIDENGIPIAWEIDQFGELLDDDQLIHEFSGGPYYFLYLVGWNRGEGPEPADVGNAGRLQTVPQSFGGNPAITWEFAEGFKLGVHAEVWFSADPVEWNPLPAADYTHSTQTHDGKTTHQLTLTRDPTARILFLRLQKT